MNHEFLWNLKSKIQEHFKNKSLKTHYFKDLSRTTYNSRTTQGIQGILAWISRTAGYDPATAERLIYLKSFLMMPLWQSNNLGIILCHQSFLSCIGFPKPVPAGRSSYPLTCWKLFPFFRRVFDFFSMTLKPYSIWILLSTQMLLQESL